MPNLGYKPRYKEGYFPVPPTDQMQDLRNEMTQNLIAVGLDVEAQHHEVATAGQAEIDLRFAPLLKSSDALLLFKYVIKNTARLRGRTVTFMPKPIFGDNGSGMHVHQSLWKNGIPLFYGYGYANGVDPDEGNPCPDGSGVEVVDVPSGERRLVLSLAQVAALEPEPTMYGAFHYMTHCQFSPSGSRSSCG